MREGTKARTTQNKSVIALLQAQTKVRKRQYKKKEGKKRYKAI